jgi:hypothetical protein
MKKTSLTFLFLVISFLIKLNAQDLNSAIDKDLINWLEKIPIGSENQYGFDNRESFISARTGTPYEVYTFSPSFFTGSLDPDLNYLVPAGEWRVPVLVNNSNKALLTVIKGGSGWQIVDIGAATMAKELEKMNQELKPGQSPLKIVRIYQLQCDFITADNPTLSPDDILLIPMRSSILNIPELSGLDSKKIALRNLYPLVHGKQNQ